MAAETDRQDTLEFATYRQVLATKFQANGFRVVDSPSDADFVAFLRYAIDSGTTVTEAYSIPQFGQTSGGTTYHSGSVMSPSGFGSFSGTSYTPPVYGITGFSTGTTTRKEFTRNVSIDIVEGTAYRAGMVRKVYEAQVRSSGSCGSLAGVFPAIAEAIFKEFPGQSGRAQTVEVPFDGKC